MTYMPNPTPAHTSFGSHIMRKRLPSTSQEHQTMRRNNRHAHRHLALQRLACTTGTYLNYERLGDEGGHLYTKGRAWW
jgi:hypothetical protein